LKSSWVDHHRSAAHMHTQRRN